MQDIRIDSEGRQRCWNCGSPAGFAHKRTTRSKVAVGVGALATKKKLKCQACGEYNDVGAAKPYKGPSSRRAAIKAGTNLVDGDDFRTELETIRMELKQASAERKERKAQRTEQRQARSIEKAARKAAKTEAKTSPAPVNGPPPSIRPTSASWLPDPDGRHEYRYWDGAAWTVNVSDDGVTSTDPLIAEPA